MKTKLAALLAVLSLLSACASRSSAGSGSSTTPSTAPAVQRIVSLSATATEMLYAIGAGKQVVAVDKNSNYPAGSPITGLDGEEPNAEAIAHYQPDLVVISNDVKNIKSQLEKLSITVMLQPAAEKLADAYQEIDALGDKTGHHDQAAQVVSAMRQRISDLTAKVPQRATPLTYYHELDSTLYTATSKTFIGQVYAMAGLKNIADAADSSGGGYPQLSSERLVKANPDLVFLADTKCCGQTAAKFAARPGFKQLTAVRDGHVVGLDDDIASRWGPRVVDFYAQVVAVTSSIKQ